MPLRMEHELAKLYVFAKQQLSWRSERCRQQLDVDVAEQRDAGLPWL